MVDTVVGKRKYGWLAALLFCVYPVHPEAVTWAAGRFDLLSTTWQLVAGLCLVKACHHLYPVGSQTFAQKSNRASPATRYGLTWYAASLFAYLLALLSKEGAIFFPLVAVVYLALEFFIPQERQNQLKGKVGAVVLTAILLTVISSFYLGLRSLVLGSLSSYDVTDYNVWSYIGSGLVEAYSVLIAPVNRVWLAGHQWLPAILSSVNWLLWGGSLVFVIGRLWLVKNSRLLTLFGLSLVWSVAAMGQL